MKRIVHSAEPSMRRIAYLALFAAAVGVASPFPDFVRWHVGPIYALELLYALFAAALLASRPSPRLGDFRAAVPCGLLLGWGLIRLCLDLTGPTGVALDWARTLQHALLIVYPALWFVAGLWLARTDRAVTALLLLVLLAVNTVPCLAGGLVSNLSLGPLSAVVLVVCVDKALAAETPRGETLVYGAISVVLAALSFWPYWRLWYEHTSMQRTTLAMLVFMLVTTPLLRRKQIGSLKVAGLLVGTLIAGFVATSLLSAPEGAPPMSVAEHLADNVTRSLDKAGGYLDPNPSPMAMVSVRRFWWSTAIADWRQSPITGRGFAVEIPSHLAPGLANDAAAVASHPEYASSKPINGPHNSYLTILARTGLIGAALFLILVLDWIRRIWPLVRGRELNLYEILVIMLPISGALHAALNVGLETPRYAMLPWFFAGAATVYGQAIADAERAANSVD